MVPRPQRKYRFNRRGLAMSAKQQKRAAALNRLNFSDASASQTYTMYVRVTIVSSALLFFYCTKSAVHQEMLYLEFAHRWIFFGF